MCDNGIRVNSKGLGKLIKAAAKAGQISEAEKWAELCLEEYGPDKDSLIFLQVSTRGGKISGICVPIALSFQRYSVWF